jgi:hypothetical protein
MLCSVKFMVEWVWTAGYIRKRMWEKVTETGGTMLACNYGREGGEMMYVLEEIWALTARIEIALGTNLR